MSTSEPQEISTEILNQPTPLCDRFGETLTVAEVRAALQELGLDVTTREAVDWSVDYPGAESARAKIGQLEAQLAEARSKKT